MKKVRINGSEETVRAETVAELLRECGLEERARGLAVAVNRVVVHRQEWARARLAEGDRVEIIRLSVGG
ncbi:sulfur carrier protein ThiS [Benzoatithermus flavus]|uniref:Sulfur carrier protein ThiS n=1 Tax=Benzoatithermus flavus TaxID=3108223 RepID=A0ABU8XQT4_9PROT